MARTPFPMVLTHSVTIAPDVKQLTLALPDGAPFEYIPGQFITIHFEWEGQNLWRSYSIATIPEDGSKGIDVAVSYVKGGPGSEYLFNLKHGDTLNVTGPFGRFVLRDETPKRYVLISTGTGVTPYRCMLPELENRLKANPDMEVVLLQGIRSREAGFYTQDFAQADERLDRFHFKACYSRAMPDHCHGYECEGYVHKQLECVDLDPQNDVVYLCGNPNMIDEAVAWLRTQGFESANLRREKYISTGGGKKT